MRLRGGRGRYDIPEAMTDLAMYKKFAQVVKVPILANITEFGATALYTVEELRGAEVSLVLYPLSAFRAMSKAALSVYGAIRREGTQKNVLDLMQTAQSYTTTLITMPLNRNLIPYFQEEKHEQ